MDNPEIYVACLAAYNNSILYGRWISATQGLDEIYQDIHDMLAKSPIANAEEWAPQGYSGFGDITIDESLKTSSSLKNPKMILQKNDSASHAPKINCMLNMLPHITSYYPNHSQAPSPNTSVCSILERTADDRKKSWRTNYSPHLCRLH
jgi:hypothetical protein